MRNALCACSCLHLQSLVGCDRPFFFDIIQARVFLDLKDEGRNDSYEHVHCRHRGPECWKNP